MTNDKNKEPRISLNKLGEYMTANITRRQAIVKDQKYPPEVKTLRYKQAREGIISFYSQNEDENILINLIDELENKSTKTKFQEDDRKSSILLLNSFLEITDSLRTTILDSVKSISFKNGFSKKACLDLSEVVVSVQPEIIIRGKDKKGNDVIGAIKLATTKNVPIEDETASFITTLMHQYLEDKVKKNEETIPLNLCILVDVYRKKIFKAPKSYILRRSQLNLACEEIKLWWEKVKK